MTDPDKQTATLYSPADTGEVSERALPQVSAVALSVIIVNYNVKDCLLQCLRSVEQAMKNIRGEIIVVDNNSLDGSVGYLRPLFPRVQFISLNENLGFGRANNLGITKARGAFILFLNPDTLLEERTLDVMLEFMTQHPDVAMSGCKVLNPDGTLQLACRRAFPTPWASFCKVFGLQRIFPDSPVFARYNQTFRNENETCFVEAISGAFMFARHSALDRIGGFDTDFFMYGEDLDLCSRVGKAGWKIAYIPSTSIIHLKGISTRSSSLDAVKLFYEAMAVFAKKHYGHSSWLLFLLRVGILLRSAIAYANRRRRVTLVLACDILSINGALLLATKLRFGTFFGFPPYAYPTVFLVLSAVMLGSMLAIGEYFESKPSVRRAFLGLMVSFFLLSSLTYFFNAFAFSRSALLMTIVFSVVLMSFTRAIVAFFDKSVGKEADRRIAIVGMNDQAEKIIRALQTAEALNTDAVGIVASADTEEREFCGLPVIGTLKSLPKLIEQYRLHEIIITDASLRRKDVMELLVSASALSARFHVAQDYEEVVVARIINEVTGVEPGVSRYSIRRLRYRTVKRLFDIGASLFLLTLGLPVLYLTVNSIRLAVQRLWEVLLGRYSIVGLYSSDGQRPLLGKIGLTGLVHVSKPDRLSQQAIRDLNEYYIRNYSLTLDFDILFKHLFRRTPLF